MEAATANYQEVIFGEARHEEAALHCCAKYECDSDIDILDLDLQLQWVNALICDLCA